MTKQIDLGKFESTKNGTTFKYRIQTITPELLEDVLDLMVTHFLPREPMSSYLGIHKNDDALNFVKQIWRKTMEGGISLVALEDTDDASVNIVGANMIAIAEKNEHEIEANEGNEFKKILAIMKDVEDKVNIFEKYNIDRYLSAFGLLVHPNYHGYQIGYRLLESRRQLCEILGLSATGTSFSAQNAQHLARKAGFETLAGTVYKSFRINDQLVFPNLEGDIKFMALKYK